MVLWQGCNSALEDNQSLINKAPCPFWKELNVSARRGHRIRQTLIELSDRVHEDAFARSIDVQPLPLPSSHERGVGYVFAVPVEQV